MSLRHAILGIVEYQPMHGYQVRRVLEEGISSFWPVNLAAIYPSLRKLEQEGLVAHRVEKSEAGRPDRKVYEITDSGREELAHWRRQAPEAPTSQKVPLFLKLLFAQPENLPDTVGWIDKEIEHLRGGADHLRSALNDPHAFSTFFVRFMRESGLAHAELQMELLGELRARVQAMVVRREADDEPDEPRRE